MKILVTGGTGFIGSYLVEKLVQDNHEVKCMVRNSSDTRRLKELGVELIIGDLGDPDSLKDVPKGCEVVYHLAAYYTFMGRKELYHKINVQGTDNLIQASIDNSVKRFIYCSTTEAVGAVKIADSFEEYATEEVECKPQYEYGRSKVNAEKIVQGYGNKIEWTIVRPSGVYGPRCVNDISYYFVRDLIQRNLSMWFRVRNSGTVHFTHVKDIVQGLDLARKKEGANEIFFISSNEALKVDTAIREICSVLERRPPRFALPKLVLMTGVSIIQLFNVIRGRKEFFLQVSSIRSITQGRNYSNRKAKELLSFSPEYDFITGIRETIKWYQEEGFF